jgi:DNA-binding NarL/FixJ family response regulator
MTAPMRIVVADRHDGFRHALRELLSADPALSVTEAADLRAAGVAVRRARAHALVVDVGLLDADRGRLGPVPAGMMIVVVGMDDTPAREHQALRAGADAYVVKDRAHTTLVHILLDGAKR